MILAVHSMTFQFLKWILPEVLHKSLVIISCDGTSLVDKVYLFLSDNEWSSILVPDDNIVVLYVEGVILSIWNQVPTQNVSFVRVLMHDKQDVIWITSSPHFLDIWPMIIWINFKLNLLKIVFTEALFGNIKSLDGFSIPKDNICTVHCKVTISQVFRKEKTLQLPIRQLSNSLEATINTLSCDWGIFTTFVKENNIIFGRLSIDVKSLWIKILHVSYPCKEIHGIVNYKCEINNRMQLFSKDLWLSEPMILSIESIFALLPSIVMALVILWDALSQVQLFNELKFEYADFHNAYSHKLFH